MRCGEWVPWWLPISNFAPAWWLGGVIPMPPFFRTPTINNSRLDRYRTISEDSDVVNYSPAETAETLRMAQPCVGHDCGGRHRRAVYTSRRVGGRMDGGEVRSIASASASASASAPVSASAPASTSPSVSASASSSASTSRKEMGPKKAERVPRAAIRAGAKAGSPLDLFRASTVPNATSERARLRQERKLRKLVINTTQFDTDGYVLVENVFSHDEIDALRQVLNDSILSLRDRSVRPSPGWYDDHCVLRSFTSAVHACSLRLCARRAAVPGNYRQEG